MYTGPHIIKDGLVFGYDTGYGIADNGTATRFYPGEPTTNLLPSAPATGTGGFARQSHHNESFTYSNVTNYKGRTNVHRLYINPSGNTSAPYADYGGQYYKSGGSAVGDVYAISFDFYVAKGNNSPSLATTYANGYKSPTNAGAASTTADSDVDLENGWTRRTRIATITIAGNTHWRFGLNTGGNETEAYLDNVQIELKSRATPFVDGTRSSTASLIDLKGTTDIDVSNMSFDSTGQPDFDGSSDKINLSDASYLKFAGGSFTVEQILVVDSISSKQRTFSKGSSGWSRGWHAAIRPTQWEFELSDGVSSPGNSFKINTATTVGTNHVVWAIEGGATAKLYINGVQAGSTQTITEGIDFATTTSAVGIGAWENGAEYFNGKIPVTRIYNKALSATEIKQNYNAYKNRFDI